MRAMVSSMSPSSRLSVSSSLSRRGSAPWLLSWCSTCATKPGCRNCRALTFTEIDSPAVSGCWLQRCNCAQAVCSTYWPSGRISPVCSASGMKSAGPIMPRCGGRQRTRVSAPIRRAWWSTTGWYYTSSSARARPWRRSASRLERALTAACMSGSKKRWVLRPAALAWYSARSARLSSSSTDRRCSPNSVTPMLSVLKCWPPSSAKGWFRLASSLSATISACAVAVRRSGARASSMTTNSSPPKRATVSAARTLATRRGGAGEEGGGELRQQLVAHVVAQGVVEVFEVVQVDEQQRAQFVRALAGGDSGWQPVEQQARVGQAGQRVVERQALDLLRCALAFGDVAAYAEHAGDAAMQVADRGLDGLEPALVAILGKGQGLFGDQWLPRLHRALVVLAKLPGLGGRGLVEVVAAHELVFGPADEALEHRVDGQVDAVGILEEHHVGHGADHPGQAAFALAQAALGLLDAGKGAAYAGIEHRLVQQRVGDHPQPVGQRAGDRAVRAQGADGDLATGKGRGRPGKNALTRLIVAAGAALQHGGGHDQRQRQRQRQRLVQGAAGDLGKPAGQRPQRQAHERQRDRARHGQPGSAQARCRQPHGGEPQRGHLGHPRPTAQPQ